jgi:hypothetical protein
MNISAQYIAIELMGCSPENIGEIVAEMPASEVIKLRDLLSAEINKFMG